MGRKRRDNIKRTMAQALYHNKIAMERILDLHNQFKEYHQEHAEFLGVILNTAIMNEQMMLQFWELSWGTPPPDTDSYRL